MHYISSESLLNTIQLDKNSWLFPTWPTVKVNTGASVLPGLYPLCLAFGRPRVSDQSQLLSGRSCIPRVLNVCAAGGSPELYQQLGDGSSEAGNHWAWHSHCFLAIFGIVAGLSLLMLSAAEKCQGKPLLSTALSEGELAKAEEQRGLLCAASSTKSFFFSLRLTVLCYCKEGRTN